MIEFWLLNGDRCSSPIVTGCIFNEQGKTIFFFIKINKWTVKRDAYISENTDLTLSILFSVNVI